MPLLVVDVTLMEKNIKILRFPEKVIYFLD